ncbi:MAG: hypothetical protein SF172_18565 [Burkholderiales bacterium]|nr:hypothetical protein [Burkholderiales bacterium]
MAAAAFLHQIYYSDATRANLDPGFIPLDNLANERPDWREYWPMRRFLLEHAGRMDESAFYGFFSPKFGEKTGMTANDAHEFITSVQHHTDVVLFPPFFDQGACYLNVFEQAISHHRGFFPTFKAAVDHIAPGVAIESLITDSRNTVFSNFFAARPRFWRDWLAANEVLFAIAESREGELAQSLNAEAPYKSGTGPVAAKVFMMERVATLLLTTQRDWRVAVRDPMAAPEEPLFAPYRAELIAMDALKIAASLRGASGYLQTFRRLQQYIAQSSRARFELREESRQASGE